MFFINKPGFRQPISEDTHGNREVVLNGRAEITRQRDRRRVVAFDQQSQALRDALIRNDFHSTAKRFGSACVLLAAKLREVRT